MTAVDAWRDERVARLARNLVLCPDRRQLCDRRSGTPRGGRRATDLPGAAHHAAVWGQSRREASGSAADGVRGSVVKLQARLRHICCSAWSVFQFSLTSQ